MPSRRVADWTLRLLLSISLLVSAGWWPAAPDAGATPVTAATGMPCHGDMVGAPGAHPCDKGCCPQSSCDPSACVATACMPHMTAIFAATAPVALEIAWPAQDLPARLVDTPLRPPIA